jgi:branched-chain amino acid transport system ATP-binding protein
VHFRGEEITAQATETLFHRGIARTFQTPRVVPGLTVLENVLVAAARLRPLELMHALMGGRGQRRVDEARRQAAGRLLEMVGLEAHADTPAQTLPHAQRRLLEIVRALAGTPAVLFLDEPAAGMSGTETAGVMALIRALATRGVAIVLVEHNMRVVMGVADRVTVLDFGRVIAEGTPAEIRLDRAVRTAYLGGVDDEPGTGSDA